MAILGLFCSVFVFVLREPQFNQNGQILMFEKQGESHELDGIAENSNVLFSMISLFCTISCVFIISAMVPL